MGKALLCLVVLLLCGVSLGSFGVYTSEREFLHEEAKVNPNVYDSLPPGHPLRTTSEEQERQGAMPTRARAVKETRATQTPRPYDGAPELTGSASGHTIGGYEPGNRFSIFDTYIINLAAGQVADLFFTISEGTAYYNMIMDVYLISTTSHWQNYLDTEYSNKPNIKKYNSTLAQHCPSYPASYYIVLQSNAIANYTVSVQKRSPNLAVGSYNNYINYIGGGHIGIPVSGTCQKLTITASFSNSFYSYLYRGCDTSGTCDAAGQSTQEITKIDSLFSKVRTQQYNIDCTTVDQYFLYISVSSYSQVNISIHTGAYPCSEMCKKNGICNTDTGVCKCRGGYAGENCERQYDQDIVTLPADGSTFNYTNNVVTPASFYPLRIVVPAGLPASKFVLVNITVMPRPTTAGLSFYWNPASMPTSSNYTATTFFSYSTSTIVNKVIPLCSQVSEWYIGLTDQAIPNGYGAVPLNTILFTITLIDIPVVTDTFGGQYTENLNALSAFSFFLYNAAYTKSVVRVDEGTPVISGISITSACTTFDRLVGSTDTGTRYQHYQVAVSSVVNTPYYIIVQSAVVNATFSGSISEGAVGTTCPNNCGGYSRGFCSKSNECVCRYGYAGPACADVDMTGVTSFGSTPVDITVPVGDANYKLAARQRLSPEPGWYQITTINTTSGVKYWSQMNRLPNTYSDGATSTVSTTGLVDFPSTVCLANLPPVYYAFTAASAEATVTVSTTQYDMTIPLDGAVKTFNQYPTSKYIPFYTPINAQSCPKAVRITVGVEDVTKFYNFYPSSSYAGQNCATTNSFRSTNDEDTAMSVVVEIKNCSQPVTGYIYFYSGTYIPTVQIKAESVNSNAPVVGLDPCNGRGEFNATGDGTCVCNYPWISSNCSVFDVKCSAIATKLKTCNTNDNVVFYDEDFLGQQTCEMINTDALIEPMIKEDVDQLNDNNYFPGKAMQMSAKCQTEYRGILCSYYFKKCNPQEGGGVRLSVPCEALTFADRCTNGLYTYNMQDIFTDIKNSLANSPFYVCGSVNGAGTTTGKTSSASGVHASVAVFVMLSVLVCFL